MLSFSESLSISKTRHNDGWGKMFRLWKYYEIVYLTCDASACNRSLKCSVPASKNHHGWNECTKIAECFTCDKEEHATDYQQQNSSKEK